MLRVVQDRKPAHAAVMLTLLDMDRPRRGLITTDARPYLRLQKSMQEN